MPVGPVTGDTVANLLMSSVAANTQAHETTAVHQPDQTSDRLRKLIILEKVDYPGDCWLFCSDSVN